MNHADNIERRIEQLHIATAAETDKRILDDAFVALHKGLQSQRLSVRQMIANSRIVRPAAVAAVILMAFALLLSTLNKEDVTLESLRSTLDNAGNICISTFQAGQSDPSQQVWTSQNLKVRLLKIGSGGQVQFALWDIPNKVKMTVYLSTVQTQPLTEQMLAELEKSVTPYSDITPFSHIRDIPDSARWSRIDDPAVAADVPGTEVYELVWTEQGTTSEIVIYRKWRVFIGARTNLPGRAESYVKSEPGQEYKLESFVIITYPSEREIQDLVANTFGPPDSRRDGPEYRGTPGANR
ncbi:MAG: hypothetical protein CEE38_02955 [Planctomycetes bacterium B3_Pla]|nr:MAG: hypothetical protein CEE38_02955 [Planctomycetes bacterium B3_Pla]